MHPWLITIDLALVLIWGGLVFWERRVEAKRRERQSFAIAAAREAREAQTGKESSCRK